MSIRTLAVNCASYALAWPVARYISNQRDRLAKEGNPLPEMWKERLSPYFDAEDLASALLVQSQSLPIPNPPFAATIRCIGLSFPDTALIAGVTFGNVIAVRETLTGSLLFHELVHVVQYRLLGVKAFSRLYVAGFLATGSYDDIPLERSAFDLEYRYSVDSQPFSVTEKVRQWIAANRF